MKYVKKHWRLEFNPGPSHKKGLRFIFEPGLKIISIKRLLKEVRNIPSVTRVPVILKM